MSDDRIDGAVKDGVGHVQDAFGGLTRDVKAEASGKWNEAAGAIQSAVGEGKDKAAGALDDAGGYLQDRFDRIADTLSDRPMLAVGLGVAVGLTLGLLLWHDRKVEYFRR